MGLQNLDTILENENLKKKNLLLLWIQNLWAHYFFLSAKNWKLKLLPIHLSSMLEMTHCLSLIKASVICEFTKLPEYFYVVNAATTIKEGKPFKGGNYSQK